MKIEIDDQLQQDLKKALPYCSSTKDQITYVLEKYLQNLDFDAYNKEKFTNTWSISKLKRNFYPLIKELGVVVIYNVHRMKHINDVHGMAYGNNVLDEVAQSLKEALGEDNVYRISGDKFFSFSGITPSKKLCHNAEVRRTVISKNKGTLEKASPLDNFNICMEFLDYTEYNCPNPYFKIESQSMV